MVQSLMEVSVESGQSIVAQSAVMSKTKISNVVVQWEPIVRACASVTPDLTEMLQAFWGVPVRLVFLGVGAQAHYFWRMDDFHVSQLTLSNTPENEQSELPMALLKLSDTACVTFMNRVLGHRSTPFSFKQLSPLEASILNELSRDLLGYFKKNLIKKPGKRSENKQVHLIWALQLAQREPSEEASASPAEEEVGKIILSLPFNAIQMKSASAYSQQASAVVPDDFFFHVQGLARIYLGKTRVALSDLDQLEPKDLVVLEESHIAQMFILEPVSGEQIPFQSRIAQQQSLTLPYTQELATMDSQPQSTSARQTLWDNLMIEVGAEFEPVKLPLKHLKEMTEGLIVEMGDLVHNRICLRVEGKILAWGELIIVGDKFGVRVCEVEASEQPAGMEMTPTQSAPMPTAAQPQPVLEEEAVEESENPDSFLDEDFDDTFEDEEEEW